jgi:hypothetical protein
MGIGAGLPAPQPERRRSPEEMARLMTDHLLTQLDDLANESFDAFLEKTGDAEIAEPRSRERTETATAYLGDVEAVVEAFAFQTAVLREMKFPQPCIESRGSVPMPVELGLRTPFARGSLLGRSINLFAFVEAISDPTALSEAFGVRRQRGVRVTQLSLKQARDAFGTRLARFLFSRFSESIPRNAPPSPGLQFTVSTNSKGLRVHYSLALLFDPTNVLSAPSTPVHGWLHPGRYVFGASRPPLQPTFDLTAEYDVPPHASAHLAL